MLKHRIMTALILIPIFLALLFLLPPIPFCLLTVLVMLLGAWEWSYFMGIKNKASFIYPVVMIILMIGALMLPLIYLLYFSVIWWIIALILVVRYPKEKPWGKSVGMRAVMGICVLIPCWLAINYIRNSAHGKFILLFLFILIWGADTGAYFAGRAWGKHKLAPSVSPGKTWEGLIGALVVTAIIALCGIYTQQVPYFIWPVAIALSMVTVLFSILGDLFESMLKRNAGLKDSGNILPGHGGILDRIDSLTAAAPIFAVGASLLGKYLY